MSKKRRTRTGLYKRAGSPYWWASYTSRSGVRVRRSTGCIEKQEAQQVLARWRIEDRKPATSPVDITFDQVLAEYLHNTRGKPTHDRDIAAARHLAHAFSGMMLSDITRDRIRRYIATRDAAPGTINKEVGLLSVAINHIALMYDWDLPNPARGMRQKEPEGRLRWLTHDEADALISAARMEPKAPHLADFIVLALNTGCRKSELLGLEWNRVDFTNGLIMLEAAHTKSAKRRYIPMNAVVRRVLQSRKSDGRYVFQHASGERIRDLKRSFHTACRRAGITNFRIHDLRHTFAAWLVTEGTPLPVVRDLLGHSSIAMTERYAHLAPDTLRAAVALLDQCDKNCDKQSEIVPKCDNHRQEISV